MTSTLTPPAQEQQGALVVLHFSPPLRRLTDDEFFDFCMSNKDLQLELTSEGDLIIMPPTGGKTGIRNSKLIMRLGMWAEQDATGVVFDSSTIFSLPNGAKRSPDATWLRKERWESLTDKQQEKFPPLCPDFVAELRSPSDSVAPLRAKMEEYVACGAQLGWLIDPFERKVHVFRPGAETEVLEDPEQVSGDPVLPGFALDVRAPWD